MSSLQDLQERWRLGFSQAEGLNSLGLDSEGTGRQVVNLLGNPVRVAWDNAEQVELAWSGAENSWTGVYRQAGRTVLTWLYLQGLQTAGLHEESDRIFAAMLGTAEAGLLQAGIVNTGGAGAEHFTWDGLPCGYEGYLPESWNFLMAAFTRDRKPGFLAEKLTPKGLSESQTRVTATASRRRATAIGSRKASTRNLRKHHDEHTHPHHGQNLLHETHPPHPRRPAARAAGQLCPCR